jgi:G:T-mismatch repair DNA endonuclease (very short patch repair protein)
LIGEKHKDKISDMISTGYSILHLSTNSVELFGEKISYDMISTTCKHNNIKIPSLKDTANSQITRDLYKSTVEKTYGSGIINVSQSKLIKEKKNNTNLDRYGVINPFQREEVKQKSKETLYQKYGVFNPVELPCHTKNNGRFSKPHKKISDFLHTRAIEHENDKPGLFRKFNDDLKRVYSPIPDIFIPDKNIVIEIFGDRWHMNPQIYHESDIVVFFDGPHTAAEVWAGEKIRNNHIRYFGVDIIIIWEYDIKHNLEEIKLMLTERLT